jgi:hypothetical protein
MHLKVFLKLKKPLKLSLLRQIFKKTKKKTKKTKKTKKNKKKQKTNKPQKKPKKKHWAGFKKNPGFF